MRKGSLRADAHERRGPAGLDGLQHGRHRRRVDDAVLLVDDHVVRARGGRGLGGDGGVDRRPQPDDRQGVPQLLGIAHRREFYQR